MDIFFETVASFTPLSDDSKVALSFVLKRMEFPKGHILVKQNSVCQYIYFIEKGLTRTFYYKNDKDVTDWLSAENMFACSIISFLTRLPDRRGIQLLEDAVLWAVHYD